MLVQAAVLLATATVGLSFSSPTLRAKKEVKLPADTTILKLEKDAPELMKKDRVPGLEIALIRNGKTTWIHAFGVKDAKTNQAVSNETTFEAASLGKPVFAYAVLKLVDQGKLSLDVPLTTYLPKPYIADDPRLSKITARLILSHRSGFPNWRSDDGLHIYFPPGDRFSYSGEGYIYLQRVVEQITGKPLNEYMTEAVFKPLGMTSSSYIWRPEFDALTATGSGLRLAAASSARPRPLSASSGG